MISTLYLIVGMKFNQFCNKESALHPKAICGGDSIIWQGGCGGGQVVAEPGGGDGVSEDGAAGISLMFSSQGKQDDYGY
ncbi:hypothetical protein E2C01_005741 [Portunus trituberculatus]|uniref:Uncharacterized protein n=1 Tax=Portunus trituberculatus TaxID=210409 RepID=A0A5B7CZZ3_PORTR|nr:hypothetical protein [Portunus trituberculatus]